MINDCPPTEREKRWLHYGNRWQRAWADLTFGLRSGIPLCCVLHFTCSHLPDSADKVFEWYPTDGCIYDCPYSHCRFHRWLLHPVEMPLSDWMRYLDRQED